MKVVSGGSRPEWLRPCGFFGQGLADFGLDFINLGERIGGGADGAANHHVVGAIADGVLGRGDALLVVVLDGVNVGPRANPGGDNDEVSRDVGAQLSGFAGRGDNPVEQLNVRIDDKLSRIRSAQGDDQEDAELDLIGYLVLKRVALRRQLVRDGVPAMRRRRYWDRVSGEQLASLADAGDGGPGAVGSPATESAGSPSTQTDEDAPGRDGSGRDWPDADVAGVEPHIMQQVQDLGFLRGKRIECSP